MMGVTPCLEWMGIRFEEHGDILTGILPYSPMLIGNPVLPALHGGAISVFLEGVALAQLSQGRSSRPKTIDFTVDFLRQGHPRDCFARARVIRAGRRFASVRVEAWQDQRDRPIAAAAGHFLLPHG